VDLEKRLVSLSRKNLNKTLFAFFSVNLEEGVTLPAVQALASRASRAALLTAAMRPFTQGLFGCMAQYNGNRTKRRMLTSAAKFDVLMWRAYLVQLMWAPQGFARSLESFRPRLARYLLEYDASLTGLGVQVSRRGRQGEEWIPWFHCGSVLPFGSQEESGRQNVCEFAAVLAGLLLLRQLGCKEFTVDVRGDNRSSLAWLHKGRVNSDIARRASVGFSLLLANMGVEIGRTDHVAGEFNGRMDGLSRGAGSVGAGLDPAQAVRMGRFGWTWRYLAECRPGVAVDTVEEFSGGVRGFLDLLQVPAPHNEQSALSDIIV
jgi:hypothetical protein